MQSLALPLTRHQCESVHQLEQELATLRETLSLEETEETWDRIARALARFSAIVKGGGYKFEKELVNGVRASARPIISAVSMVPFIMGLWN
jgi:hypothetical protein